jgi:hypothetical protein
MAENEILYRVVKTRYSASYDYTKRQEDPERFQGYYISKSETCYRERKSDVQSAINYAKRANEDADRTNAKWPRVHQDYYRVEVSIVGVFEIEPYDKVIPDAAT